MNWIVNLLVTYVGRDGNPMTPVSKRFMFDGYDRDEAQLRAVATVANELIEKIEDDDMCGEQRQSIHSISVQSVREV